MSVNYKKLTLIILFLAAFGFANAQEELVFELDAPNRLVNDYAQVMSAQEVQNLESKLKRYADSTSTQICVVTIKNLNEYEVMDYAFRIGDKWGVGVKGKNNGIVILVAIQDGKAAITTGYGMEATVTDAATLQIRKNQMGPRFKEGKFYQGLEDGTTAIIKLAAGEYVNENPNSAKKKTPVGLIVFLLIFFVLLPIISAYRNAKGRSMGSRGQADFWTILMLMSLGGGGRGGSGFGGGGGGDSFGGFGGGGFGGGGSGGDW